MNSKNTLLAAMGVALLSTAVVAPLAQASAKPFTNTQLVNFHDHEKGGMGEGKCGEGACGEEEGKGKGDDGGKKPAK